MVNVEHEQKEEDKGVAGGMLQGYSLGRQVYYHFGDAYGMPPADSAYAKRGGTLVYIGTEQQVKEALATGRRSKRELKNLILDEERRRTAQPEGGN